MKDFLKRLTSRKFLLAVAGMLAGAGMIAKGFALNDMNLVQQGIQLLGLSNGVFIIIEGIIDTVTSYQTGKSNIEKVRSDVELLQAGNTPAFGTTSQSDGGGIDVDRVIQPGQ